MLPRCRPFGAIRIALIQAMQSAAVERLLRATSIDTRTSSYACRTDNTRYCLRYVSCEFGFIHHACHATLRQVFDTDYTMLAAFIYLLRY